MAKSFTSPFVGASSVNQGLRSYMLGIYRYMSYALALSGLVSYLVARSGLAVVLFSSPFGILFSLAPVFVALYFTSRIHTLSFQAAQAWFFVYATLMGFSLSTVFVVFTSAEVTLAFAVASSMFAGLSLYGYTTKKDLTSMGSFLFMAVWGLLVASLLNLFFRSSAVATLMSFVAVFVFSLMTAYDVQKLKRMYYLVGGVDGEKSKIHIFGAMQLYLDFVNLFLHLLHLIRLTSSRND
jgi:FtsH-binding integral membrane protein